VRAAGVGKSDGRLYIGTSDGIFATPDRGTTWSGPLFNQAGTWLEVDPHDSNRAYYLTYGEQVYRTIDGANWTPLKLPAVGSSVHFALDQAMPGVVYVGGTDGFFSSTDSGQTWTKGSNGWPVGRSLGALAVDPRTTGTVYAGFSNFGMWKTTTTGR
jgi:photosystem II stability/assembly factor-like uncharacterized protein